MRIGYCTADWSQHTDEKGHPISGGSGYYRTVLPYTFLKRNGIDVVMGGSMGVQDGEIKIVDLDGRVWDGCDIIVLQRWMGEEAPRIIKGARAVGQVVINDVDDWYEGISTSNRAWADSHKKNNAKVNREHYRKAIQLSSGLIVSTPYLAQKYAKCGIPVEIVRNAIDLDRWTRQPVIDQPPTIGWVGATSWRSRDLETLRGVLGPFMEKNKLRFIHGGAWDASLKASELLGLPDGVETVEHQMVPVNEYPGLFEGIDIGIAPLSRNPFNESKSAIKLMEYTAAGIPSISSDLPEYSWLNKKHGIGLIANKPKDWTRHLNDLLDIEKRQEVSDKSYEALKALDIANLWTDWYKAYVSIFSLTQ